MQIILLLIQSVSVIGSLSLVHLARRFFSNSRSALDFVPFVESAISKLVSNHAVAEVPFVPHVVNPLSVSIQFPSLGEEKTFS